MIDGVNHRPPGRRRRVRSRFCRFYFEHVAPPDPDHPVGLAANHSSEIMYVFGDLDLVSSIGFHFRPEDHQTSMAMQKYWTNFAKTSDPNGEGLPKWPVYAADTQ